MFISQDLVVLHGYMRLQGTLLLSSVGTVRTEELSLHAAFVLKVLGKGSLVLVCLAALVARELHIQEAE